MFGGSAVCLAGGGWTPLCTLSLSPLSSSFSQVASETYCSFMMDAFGPRQQKAAEGGS